MFFFCFNDWNRSKWNCRTSITNTFFSIILSTTVHKLTVYVQKPSAVCSGAEVCSAHMHYKMVFISSKKSYARSTECYRQISYEAFKGGIFDMQNICMCSSIELCYINDTFETSRLVTVAYSTEWYFD